MRGKFEGIDEDVLHLVRDDGGHVGRDSTRVYGVRYDALVTVLGVYEFGDAQDSELRDLHANELRDQFMRRAIGTHGVG